MSATGEPSFRDSVDLMFKRATALMDLAPGLEEKIRVCNSTYTVRFGVRLRGKIETFTIAGEDKVFKPAQAKIEKDTVLVTSAEVPEPVAVRYAWADNPVCNLFSADGLPVTPFRTDDFEMTTKPKAAAKL